MLFRKHCLLKKRLSHWLMPFFFCLVCFKAVSQQEPPVDTPFNKHTIADRFALRKALEAIKEGDYFLAGFRPDYESARKAYQKAQQINPNNLDLNLKIALCYLYSPNQNHMQCLPYYRKALAMNPEVERYISFYLGEVHHRNKAWEKAIGHYEKHLGFTNDDDDITLTNKRIEECRHGITLSKQPANVRIENLGKPVNSALDEYGAVITADESTLYFTSRRSDTFGGGKDSDGKYFEDIYESTKENGKWTPPKNMGSTINSKENDAVVSISPDGKKMIVYREGDLFYSEKNEDTGQWTTSNRLPKPINTRFIETSAAFSPSGDTLYFTSNRNDLTTGGLDIFYVVSTQKKDGKEQWSKPVNLGTRINTPYNEDGVFVHPEGHTLYFSSTGHNSMGGYDIFSAKMGKNGWEAPKNIGVPINTPDDELYISLAGNGRYGYYSSSSKDGAQGEDIYRLTFLDVAEEVADKPLLLASKTGSAPLFLPAPTPSESAETEAVYFAVLKTIVSDKDTKTPLPSASVNLSGGSLVLKTNENGEAQTLLASASSDLQFALKIDKTNYRSGQEKAVLSQDNKLTLKIMLRKQVAKTLRLADTPTGLPPISEDVAQHKMPVSSVKAVQNFIVRTAKISVRDNRSKEIVKNTQLDFEFRNQDGSAAKLSVKATDGTANVMLPENMTYQLKAVAAGYLPVNIKIGDTPSKKLTVSLHKKAARKLLFAEEIVAEPAAVKTPDVALSAPKEQAKILVFKKKILDKYSKKPISSAKVLIKTENKEYFINTNSGGWAKTIITPGAAPQLFRAEAAGYLAYQNTISYAESDRKTELLLTPQTTRVLRLSREKISPLAVSEVPPSAQKSTAKIGESPLFFAAKVLDAKTQKTVKGSIQIIDKDSGKPLLFPVQAEKTAAFFTHLPPHRNLTIVVEAEGYLYHSENFRVNTSGNYVLSEENILLKPVSVGESITLNNVIFEVSSVNLAESSFAELNRLVSIMQKNPTLRIEISGHTDFTRGRNKEGLLELSLLRAQSVKNYLVKKGIKAARMIEKGYGASRPIVSNEDTELKYLNRRVEFKILSR